MLFIPLHETAIVMTELRKAILKLPNQYLITPEKTYCRQQYVFIGKKKRPALDVSEYLPPSAVHQRKKKHKKILRIYHSYFLRHFYFLLNRKEDEYKNLQ